MAEKKADFHPTDEMEREANQFALCLLMPEQLVRAWVSKYGPPVELTEDRHLRRMARAFGVSMTMAGIRLQQLGIWRI